MSRNYQERKVRQRRQQSSLWNGVTSLVKSTITGVSGLLAWNSQKRVSRRHMKQRYKESLHEEYDYSHSDENDVHDESSEDDSQDDEDVQRPSRGRRRNIVRRIISSEAVRRSYRNKTGRPYNFRRPKTQPSVPSTRKTKLIKRHAKARNAKQVSNRIAQNEKHSGEDTDSQDELNYSPVTNVLQTSLDYPYCSTDELDHSYFWKKTKTAPETMDITGESRELTTSKKNSTDNSETELPTKIIQKTEIPSTNSSAQENEIINKNAMMAAFGLTKTNPFPSTSESKCLFGLSLPETNWDELEEYFSDEDSRPALLPHVTVRYLGDDEFDEDGQQIKRSSARKRKPNPKYSAHELFGIDKPEKYSSSPTSSVQSSSNDMWSNLKLMREAINSSPKKPELRNRRKPVKRTSLSTVSSSDVSSQPSCEILPESVANTPTLPSNNLNVPFKDVTQRQLRVSPSKRQQIIGTDGVARRVSSKKTVNPIQEVSSFRKTIAQSDAYLKMKEARLQANNSWSIRVKCLSTRPLNKKTGSGKTKCN